VLVGIIETHGRSETAEMLKGLEVLTRRKVPYGNATLDELLRELGVVFNPQTLHNPKATPSGIKEFDISAKWTWGHDRVM